MIKKVVLIANAGFTIINFRSELINSLQIKGYEVYIVCPSESVLMNGRDLFLKFSELGVNYVPIRLNRSSLNPLSEIKFLFQLYRILQKIKPDLIFNYTIKPTIYGSIAGKMAGVKVISSNITGIGYVFTARSIKAKIISFIVKLQYRLALAMNSLVFFQNPDDRDFFVHSGLVKYSKCKVINGSGVDLKKFRRLSNNQKKNSFIFVGRLLRDKGIYEYINAAKILKSKYPNAIFSVVGSIDDNPSSLSSSEIENLIREGVIDYKGSCEDVRPFLAEHAVFVLPSYREGTPRSSLEAMAMSMPVITTNVPGCRETVIEGYNGYMVDVRNHHQLAEAMEKFIFDESLIHRYGMNSRKIACEKYDVEIVNESILSVLV